MKYLLLKPTVVALALVQTSTAALWQKHVVRENLANTTVVAADFTGDSLPDIISNSGGKTILFVAPDWKEVLIDKTPGNRFIHSEFFDVDGDGDPDYIGARYSPGRVAWLECPADPTTGPWKSRIVDQLVNGVHGLLKGDVNGDGKMDLIANSGQPVGTYQNSAVWLEVPKKPHQAKEWIRHVFADKDAPGLSHYLGFGDVNGDGRADISMGSKGGPSDKSGQGEWFAWWEAGADPTKPFKKHKLPGRHPGATNIQQADVNGDGLTDFVASRGHGLGVIWFEAPDWRIRKIHSDIEFPHCLQVVDMDGDGDIDAATCGYGSEQVAWYENNGKGKFRIHIVANNQAAYDIRAVDMDGDKDLDLLIAGQRSKNVVWYANPKR
jgi:hypothetical protein